MALSKAQMNEMVKHATRVKRPKADVVRREVEATSQDDDVPVGLHGILAASEKLLAVNRGLAPADERDSLQFKRVMSTPELLRERVRLDADKTRLNTLRQAAKFRSLKRTHPFLFDAYTEGHLLGNPLSSPLEEINPISLVESSHRITQMGPGGLGSTDAITDEARALHPSQFGFLCAISGPECFPHDGEVYVQRGWTAWPDVRADDVFACRIDGHLEWHLAYRLIKEPYKGPMLIGEHKTIRMAVTPTHRVLFTHGHGTYNVAPASDVFGHNIRIPIRHEPHQGDPTFLTFSLPAVSHGGNAQRTHSAFDIGDWCEFVGWWLAEGSLTPTGLLRIHQCPVANPDKHERIFRLMLKMGLIGAGVSKTADAFACHTKQMTAYFRQWTNRCYDKWIPEELFMAPIPARQRMLDALLLGDGRTPRNRKCYCTVSRRLAESVERLAIGLGFTAFIREERDARPHVKTTNYVVSIHRMLHRQLIPLSYAKPTTGVVYGNNWSVEDYDGLVYCATVPGGLLHVRGKKTTSGYWSGNSEKIGIDTRAATGVKLGSDGQLRQQFLDHRSGKVRWLSPEDVADHTVALPE